MGVVFVLASAVFNAVNTDYLKIAKEPIAKALSTYGSIHRRYEKIIVSDLLTIIDDFGHTPIEIDSVINAIQQDYIDAKIICIPCLKQLHRTRRFLKDFGRVLARVNICYIPPITPGLGDKIDNMDNTLQCDLVGEINKANGRAILCIDESDATKNLHKYLSAIKIKSIVLIIGSICTEKILIELKNYFVK